MTKDEAIAFDLALNALLWANIEINDWRDDAHGYKTEDQPQIMEAIAAIKQARSAPVQEPVGYITQARCFVHLHECTEAEAKLYGWKAISITPPAAQRQWVGLTARDWNVIGFTAEFRAGAEWANDKLKEKNNG
jgi:hypothetical protein